MDNFEKLTSPSLKDLFVSRIAGLILSGKLRVGEKFPPERTLAEQMGVGKTVVHSGLQELQRLGLVTIKPQSGVFVADYMRDGNLATFNAIVRFNGDNLSVDTIAGLFDLRLAVEGAGMLAFAQKHTPEDIARLRECIGSLGDFVASEDFTCPDFAARLYEFPKLICRLGGKPMLALVFKSVEEGAVYLTERYVRSIGTAAAINELSRFADKLEAGDGEGAVEQLRNCMDAQKTEANTITYTQLRKRRIDYGTTQTQDSQACQGHRRRVRHGRKDRRERPRVLLHG